MHKLLHILKFIFQKGKYYLFKYHLHLCLIPLLFVINNYIVLAGLFYPEIFIWPFFQSLLILGFILLLFYLVLKNFSKASIITSITGIIIFFFGNIKDTLITIPLLSYISSYKILLPTLTAAIIIIYLKIKKSNSLINANLYLNILLFLYLGIEIKNLIQLNRLNILSNEYSSEFQFNDTKVTNKPTIYYIVMDGYPASSVLRRKFNVQANNLDSGLIRNGFYIASGSFSNYNYTGFSIHSMLYMNYVEHLRNISKAEPEDFSKTAYKIGTSPLINWFAKEGYKIYNLSAFDLPRNRTMAPRKFFFDISPEIIFQHTFWRRIQWQVIPAIFPSYYKKLFALQFRDPKRNIHQFKKFNAEIYDSLIKIPSINSNVPKFIYAHFQMPHAPYLFDSTGHLNNESILFTDNPAIRKQLLKGYIAYVNNKTLTIVENILNNDKNALIIFQSDHGCREYMLGLDPEDGFKNYSAFYFPDKDYRLLYDSMSNVNTFRIILNKYFNQQLPLLKDTSKYLQF